MILNFLLNAICKVSELNSGHAQTHFTLHTKQKQKGKKYTVKPDIKNLYLTKSAWDRFLIYI